MVCVMYACPCTVVFSTVRFCVCLAWCTSTSDLLNRESGAERADGFGVLRSLLLDLQKLGGLNEGLQGGGCTALLQVSSPQPLLHLADVVPNSDTHAHTDTQGWPQHGLKLA